MNKTISVQVAFRINKAQIPDTVTNPEECFEPIAKKMNKTQLQIHLQLTNLLFNGRSEFQFSSQCKINRTIFCITEAGLNMWLDGAPWSPRTLYTYIHTYIYIYLYILFGHNFFLKFIDKPPNIQILLISHKINQDCG